MAVQMPLQAGMGSQQAEFRIEWVEQTGRVGQIGQIERVEQAEQTEFLPELQPVVSASHLLPLASKPAHWAASCVGHHSGASPRFLSAYGAHSAAEGRERHSCFAEYQYSRQQW